MLRKPLVTIVEAAALAGSLPGVREKLDVAGKHLLTMTVDSHGRYSRYHLEALEKVLSAYGAVAAGAAAGIAAEKEAVSRALEAERRAQEAERQALEPERLLREAL